MAFADLTANLRLNIQQFTNAINNARRQAQRFSSYLAQATNDGSADRLVEGYTSLNDRLHKVGLGLKDIARIAAGITISQSFYTITRSIREATDALWSFNESLDYAQVTYGALFGDSSLASDFIDTLKDFSVDTIFEYSDIEGMARKLSAYGIEYKNLMYIIEGLTNIGTISGDTAALERLAVAIGQINAKGTLKAEEMRQLANAYTPIYDILREKLGLSEDELGMVGDLGISSADAINAIIEYANETFGATADAAVLTITGLNNRVVDSLKVLGSSIIAPLTTFYKSFVKFFADSLAEIQQIYEKSGLGGVFEHLVPDEGWQHRIRSFIAALHNMISTVAALVMTLWPYISQFFGGMLDAITIFISVLNTAMSALVGFLQAVSNGTPILSILTSALVSAAAGWVLFKIHALGAMVISALKVVLIDVAKAVLFLTTVLTKNPIIAGLLLLGAVLIGVASNARNTNSAISDLINSFNSISIGGSTADDILQSGDAMEDATDSSDKFWESMEDGATDAEDAIDGAGNSAKKAARNLLSFDEVFRLTDENAEGNGGLGEGALDGIGDLTDAFSGLGEALIPEIPDLSTFANDFISSLYDNLWESIKVIASGGATGALIGGLVGFALGGIATGNLQAAIAAARIGAGIGGIVGAGFAGFWTDTYKELESSLLKIAGGGAMGMLAGALAGLIIGAFATKSLDGALTAAHLGAKIGTFVGLGLGSFWALATEEMNNAVEGLLVGGASGAFAGALLGLVIGAFIGPPGERLKTALAGARLGAAIGSAIGGALGTFWSQASDDLKDSIKNAFGDIKEASYGALIGSLVGMLIGAVVGAFVSKGTKILEFAKAGAMLGSGIGAIFGAIGDELKGMFLKAGIGEAFDELFKEFAGVGVALKDLGDELLPLLVDILKPLAELFITILSDVVMPLLKALLPVVVDLIEPLIKLATVLIKEIVTPLVGMLGEHIVTTLTPIIDIISFLTTNVIVPFVEGLGVVVEMLGWFLEACATAISSIIDIVSSVFTGDIPDSIQTAKDAFAELEEKVYSLTLVQWLLDMEEATEEFTANLDQTLQTWIGDTISDIEGWVEDVKASIRDWAESTESDFIAWSVDTSITVSDWVIDTKKSFLDWCVDTVLSFTKWGADTDKSIADWSANVESTINTWVTNASSSFVQWHIDTYKTISGWASETAGKLSWWSKSNDETLGQWFGRTSAKLSEWYTNTTSNMSKWVTDTKASLKNWWGNLWNPTTWASGWTNVKSWFEKLFKDIKNWFSNLGTSVSDWWDGLWEGKTASVASSVANVAGNAIKGVGDFFALGGHATGGIFNREHIARFAEGNKAEAVIPLENNAAMQPFVNAISDGILQGLLPAMASGSGSSNTLPPMYVGTLIADERGLQELYRKFELFEVKELARKGLL